MIVQEKLSASLEDYLEAIVGLVRENGRARVRDIAAKLSVAKPSVTVALRSLRDRELVNYSPYSQVTLTRKGTALADNISRRHEKLSAFFMDVLDMDRELAEANACRIEHAIGDTAMSRLQSFVEFMSVSTCPANELPELFREHYLSEQKSAAVSPRHGTDAGAAVATVDNQEKENPMNTTLADLRPGDRGTVLKVKGAAAAGGRLLDMGLTRGVTVSVRRVAPLGDPLEVDVRGYNLSLRKDEAKCVFVERTDNAE